MIFFPPSGSVKIIGAELSAQNGNVKNRTSRRHRVREGGMNSVRLGSRLSRRQKKGKTKIVFLTAETRQKSTFM